MPAIETRDENRLSYLSLEGRPEINYGISASLLDLTTEIPYLRHAYRCRNPRFLAAAAKAGVSDVEREDMVSIIASNPMLGDEIPGSGGYRKVRFAGKGKGKSGGYRTITFYSGANVPVFLITVFGKGMKANLSKAEINILSAMSKKLIGIYAKKVVPLRSRK